MTDPTPIDTEASLREEKLRLESLVLRGKLSQRFFFLELCKALAGPIAVAAFFWTMYTALSQRNDARIARADERFERAISRVGSAQVPERLTGVAGLEQTVRSEAPDHKSEALQYLVNAAVIEKDATVRGAILNIFSGLRDLNVGSGALNKALVYARDRNRTILRQYSDRFFLTPLSNQRMPNGPEYSEVPIGKLSVEEKTPLDTTASLIAALVRAGAKVRDLSGIYCVECDLRSEGKQLDLSHTNFDHAFLRRAHFDDANLSDASFHNADLVSTWFAGANLRDSNFSADVPVMPWQELAGIASDNLLAMHGADFTCADLTGADFRGRPIFSFIYDNPVINPSQHDNFSGALLTGSKLTGFQFLVGIPQDRLPKSKTAIVDVASMLPVTITAAAGPSQTISSVNGKKYVLWSVATDDHFAFIKQFDMKGLWDIVLAFRQLHSARDLWNAELPEGLRSYLRANEALFSPSLGDPGCAQRALNHDTRPKP